MITLKFLKRAIPTAISRPLKKIVKNRQNIRLNSQSSQSVTSGSVSTEQNKLESKTINFGAFLQANGNVAVAIAGQDYYFPSLWLRDNCTCEKCFHSSSRSRIINWSEFDVNVLPVSLKTLQSTLIVNWSDGHRSSFEFEWLLERNFRPKDQEEFLNGFYRPPKILWNEDDSKELFEEFSYGGIMSNDTFLKEWLQRLSVNGVAFLNEVPPSSKSSRRLAERIGFIRRTHYGEEYEVKADPMNKAVNVAYLSHNLQLHTDLPYYEYKPGVTMLHYLEQAKGDGAENILTDMHYVANVLKSKVPKAYEILSKIPVDWTDIGEQDGKKFYNIYRSPVIVEDTDGNIVRINHSIPQRGSHFNIPIDQVKPWYEALHNLVSLAYKHGCYFKPKPGTLLAFDNIRIVHGRTKYKDVPGNTRYLIGCYLDWDEIYSRLRCLLKPF